jgi:hypothetical protein
MPRQIADAANEPGDRFSRIPDHEIALRMYDPTHSAGAVIVVNRLVFLGERLAADGASIVLLGQEPFVVLDADSVPSTTVGPTASLLATRVRAPLLERLLTSADPALPRAVCSAADSLLHELVECLELVA